MPVINEFTTEFNQLNHHRKITSKSQQILGNFHFFHFFFCSSLMQLLEGPPPPPSQQKFFSVMVISSMYKVICTINIHMAQKNNLYMGKMTLRRNLCCQGIRPKVKKHQFKGIHHFVESQLEKFNYSKDKMEGFTC